MEVKKCEGDHPQFPRGEKFIVNRPLCGLDRQNKGVGDNKALHLFKICALMRFV